MIRVTSIAINAFRGIQSGRISDLTDVNVIVGRNNSGKTTIAEAASWALEVLGSVGGNVRDPIQRTPSQVWKEVRRGSFAQPELWFRQDQSHPLSVTIKLGDITFSTGLVAKGGGLQQTQSCQPDVRSHDHEAVHFARSVTIFRPPDATNPNIEQQLWPKLISNRRDKALTRVLNDIFKMDAEGFHPLPNGQLQVLFPSYSISIDLQGDGTRAAFRCLMMLAAVSSTLFILEEPECHQHPGSLERFALALCKQAKEQQVQLLISTHSTECVRSFLAGAKHAGSDSAVFHLSLDNGRLHAKRLDAETVGTLEATGVDVRSLDLYA